MKSSTQVIEKGRKTKAPQALCKLGKAMPTMKLQVHDDRLPMDMATGRGATSNNSVNRNRLVYKYRYTYMYE